MPACMDDASAPSSTTRPIHRVPVVACTDARRQGGTSSRIYFYSSYFLADKNDYVNTKRLHLRPLHMVKFWVTPSTLPRVVPDLG